MGSLRSKFLVVAGDALIVSWRRASGGLHQLRKNFLLGCVCVRGKFLYRNCCWCLFRAGGGADGVFGLRWGGCVCGVCGVVVGGGGGLGGVAQPQPSFKKVVVLFVRGGGGLEWGLGVWWGGFVGEGYMRGCGVEGGRWRGVLESVGGGEREERRKGTNGCCFER